MRYDQTSLFDDNPEYDAFVDKFVPKKTTDDCYTPANVYNAVADWVAREYGLDRAAFLRPFWPDADFEAVEYPDGCVVVDNPPFSIRSAVVDFYAARGVRFFLFSPALTLILPKPGVTAIAVGISIVYENGAEVPTSFLTNLEPGTLLRTAPELYAAIDAANRENLRGMKKQLPRYEYPDAVITAAIAQRWCKYGVDYRLASSDGSFIRALDDQRAAGKSIFGGGYLLSNKAAAERAAAERAAAERAAAERAAAEQWQLSARERAVMDSMSYTQEAMSFDT